MQIFLHIFLRRDILYSYVPNGTVGLVVTMSGAIYFPRSLDKAWLVIFLARYHHH